MGCWFGSFTEGRSQCGIVSTKLGALEMNPHHSSELQSWILCMFKKEILISFWMWDLFFFFKCAIITSDDWFLLVPSGICFLRTFFLPACGWKLFFDVIVPIRLNWLKSKMNHYALRHFERGQSWKLPGPCQPADCQSSREARKATAMMESLPYRTGTGPPNNWNGQSSVQTWLP